MTIWICPCGTEHRFAGNTTGYQCAFCRAPYSAEAPTAITPEPIEATTTTVDETTTGVNDYASIG